MKNYAELKKKYENEAEELKKKLPAWEAAKRVKTKDGKDFENLAKNFEGVYFYADSLYVRYDENRKTDLFYSNINTADEAETKIKHYIEYLKKTIANLNKIISSLAGFYDSVVEELEKIKAIRDEAGEAFRYVLNDMLGNSLDSVDLYSLEYSDGRIGKAKEKAALITAVKKVKRYNSLSEEKAEELMKSGGYAIRFIRHGEKLYVSYDFKNGETYEAPYIEKED